MRFNLLSVKAASPIMFLMVSISIKSGIRWIVFQQLENLDFTDDLADISKTRRQIQDKSNVNKTELITNAAKEVMVVNDKMVELITIDGHLIKLYIPFKTINNDKKANMTYDPQIDP